MTENGSRLKYFKFLNEIEVYGIFGRENWKRGTQEKYVKKATTLSSLKMMKMMMMLIKMLVHPLWNLNIFRIV